MDIKLKKINEKAIIPQYAHSTDAGMDLYSTVDIEIMPNKKDIVPTGIAMAIPEGYVGLIWDKSGMANKGWHRVGGVIDASYRGEIKVMIYNLSKNSMYIKSGQKVAQMLIQEVKQCNFTIVEDLNETNRGNKGFGSTGE